MFKLGFFKVSENNEAYRAVQIKKKQAFGRIPKEQASRNGHASMMIRF